MLTVYGDVIYNTAENFLRVEKPLYLMPDKSFLIRKLRGSLMNKKALLVLVIIPFLISTLYLYRKVVDFYKRMKLRNEAQKKDRLSQIYKLIADDYRCTVCKANPRNMILKPCFHFVMCRQCHEEAQRKNITNCPTCKRQISDSIEIFFA